MAIQQKTYTLDEYRAFCELPQNRDRLFELLNGEIVEKMASFTPSKIGMTVGFFFKLYLREHDIGYITGADGSYILTPDYAPMPDVGYISKARLPEAPEREVEGPPDLAVEVKSPSDSKREMRQKAEMYLKYGTKMVWLVFPDEQEVEVYVPDKDVMTFKPGMMLDGMDVLPGFTLPVSEIFK